MWDDPGKWMDVDEQKEMLRDDLSGPSLHTCPRCGYHGEME
jgi:hypothetical protein